MKNLILSSTFLAFLPGTPPEKRKPVQRKPNIVIIYVDDLGFGDVGVNGAQGVKTPNVDYLAAHGVNFLDAHASASTCTPSRYSLLTGSYAFRNNTAILPGDAPLIIDPDKGTLPSMLHKAGYKTGVIGKWHLGLGRGKVDWNSKIKPGPLEIGFDYSFLIPATGDRVPCVFLENQRVVGADANDPIQVSYSDKLDGFPQGSEHPELLKVKADTQHSNSIINGVSRIGYMKGGKNALWKDEDFPMTLVNKAKDFFTQHKDQPFFLYFSFHDIHVPRVPNSQFVGKSSMGARGDAIAQMDWCTGEIIARLKELGLEDQTLVIFSSDNGPVLDDGYDDKAVELLGNHHPGGVYRGGKYSAFEAGTRMPTIVYWPGHVKKSVSHALLSQVDLYASLAQLAGQKIEKRDAPDSQNMLDAWLGKDKTGRTALLEESYSYALRMNNWKLIVPQKGVTPDWLKNKAVETGLSDDYQLFDLKTDPSERNNIAKLHPLVVAEMEKKIKQIMAKP